MSEPVFITMAPTSGDTEFPGSGTAPTGNWTAGGDREPTLEYMTRIAEVAERTGFSTLLLPVGTGCLDGWVTASALAARTTRLRFMVAVRPGFVQPAVAAREAATFDYLSGGRLDINVVTGGAPNELARDGDFLAHDERYRRTEEFVEVLRRLLSGEQVSHEGAFFQLRDAVLYPAPVQHPRPPFFIAGESEPGRALAAREADVYMTWGGPWADLRGWLESARARETAIGRSPGHSVSFQIILGDTEDAAWRRAGTLLEHMREDAVVGQRDHLQQVDSSGQQRLASYVAASTSDQFRIGPNLWAGLTRVLSGNSIALVGTADQVADRIAELCAMGFDHILLRGFPHLEMIERIGEEILPRVRRRVASAAADTPRP